MPGPPRPLPAALRRDALTVADARAAGVGWVRLQASDLTRAHHGIYIPTATTPSAAGRDVWTPAELAAYQREHPDVVVSHGSAAALHGLTVPERITRAGPVHVSVGEGGGRPERAGLVPHRISVPVAQRGHVDGVVVTSAPRTLWDLCAPRFRLTEAEIVVAGDALLAPPWIEGVGPGEPAFMPGRLRQTLHERGRFHGRSRAQAALDRMRVGAGSPRETLLRLALVDAGLPEPEVQARLHPGGRSWPTVDLAYRRWRLVLQYEGRHHRTAAQQERDVARDRWCADEGFEVIKVRWADHADGYRGVIRRVRRRAAEFA